MPSYWWQCLDCRQTQSFGQVTESTGITHFLWDVLLPTKWDQSKLIQDCPSCHMKSLRIAYRFPRLEETTLLVVHIVGLGPYNGVYLPMMWETLPNDDPEVTWFDFKYVNGRNPWGLNKPAVLTRTQLRELFALYKERTSDSQFP